MTHKLSRQLLSLLLSVMLVLSMSSVAFAAEEDEYTSSGGQVTGSYTYTSLLSGDIYYGELSPMAKRIYNGLKSAMANPTESWLKIEMPLNTASWDDFTEKDLITAYSALRNEWPELFQWVDLSFAFTVESNNINWRVSYFLGVQEAYCGASRTYISPSDNGPGTLFEYWLIKPQTVNEQQKRAEARAMQVLAAAPAGDDYDKVVYFNNWIIDNTVYDTAGIGEGQPYDNTYHIAGVFLDGMAVCEGYAKALKYLCDKAGIECLYITGNLVMDDAGNLGPHAWNYVKLDGAWYIVDPTNNDQIDASFRNMLLCIGTNDPWSDRLIPDGAYDPENAVFVPTPGVTLSTDNYGDRAKSITFTAPTKTKYLPGEALDLTGGSIQITRYNGATDSVDMTADMLSGLDLNKAGLQQVTVTYNGKVAANKLAITVKNAPVAASVHDAVVNYAIGVSSLDLSKGYAKVTYADNTVARPKLNDSAKVTVTLDAAAMGVSGLVAGEHTVTVTVLDQNRNFVTTYKIGVGEDNVLPEIPEVNPPQPPTSGGSDRGSSSNVPNALTPTKAIEELKKLDPKSPPAGSKPVTVGGKSILTLPMAIPSSGMLDVGTVTQLGALPAGVGVVINQGSGKPELLIPGGFKFVAEPGQFALPLLVTNELSTQAKTPVTAALNAANRTLVYSGTLGGTTITKFPVAFTVMVPVKLAEGTSVTVQMVNPTTGKVLSTVTVKVVNGMVSFPTTTTGGIVLSTAK